MEKKSYSAPMVICLAGYHQDHRRAGIWMWMNRLGDDWVDRIWEGRQHLVREALNDMLHQIIENDKPYSL